MNDNNVGMLKKWFILARPNKRLLFIDICVILFGVVCLIVAPVFAAKVIVNLTNNNYLIAIVCLTYYYVFISSERLVLIVKYKIYSKLIGSVYLPLQRQIYEKAKDCGTEEFDKHSKEKMLNIYHNDALTISVFADMLTSSFSNVARVILTLGAVFYINKLVAILLLAINVINYFIYDKLAKRQAKANQATFDTTDKEYEAFSQALNYNSTDEQLEAKIKQNFLYRNERFIKAKHNHSMSNSSLENLYYVYYNLIVYALTILMIFFLSKGQVNLTLYLIVIPYISSGMEVCNSLFTYITQLNSVNVAMNRVSILLNLDNKEARNETN